MQISECYAVVMQLSAADKERFESRIELNKETGCWEWRGSLKTREYGTFVLNGKTYMAHRFAFEVRTGIDPGDKFVLHKCDNRPCVNPDHLFLGTQKDNIHDCMKKRRRPVSCSNKFNYGTANLIRDLWKTSGMSFAEIGRIYGTQRQAIRRICRNLTWTRELQ